MKSADQVYLVQADDADFFEPTRVNSFYPPSTFGTSHHSQYSGRCIDEPLRGLKVCEKSANLGQVDEDRLKYERNFHKILIMTQSVLFPFLLLKKTSDKHAV